MAKILSHDFDDDKRKLNCKKRRRRHRHHVRDIMRELKTSTKDSYYDYIDKIEDKTSK